MSAAATYNEHFQPKALELPSSAGRVPRLHLVPVGSLHFSFDRSSYSIAQPGIYLLPVCV